LLRFAEGGSECGNIADQALGADGLGYSRIMSERDDRYVGNDLPRTTGEFRAAPDASASTAEFKAFASGSVGGQVTDTGSWPEQPWAGDPPSAGPGRWVGVAIGVVVAIIVIVVVAVVFA
jgi:hypothetical protein